MKKILFLTRSLEYGGAERQLAALVKGMDPSRFDVTVMSFYPGGVLEKELVASDIRMICLHKQGRWDVIPFTFRLIRQISLIDPQVIHGYLEVPNILSACIKPIFRTLRVIFGVRASFMDMQQYDWLYSLVRKVEAYLSKFSDVIIVNSSAGKSVCIKRGFPPEKIEVIHNGIDTLQYQKDEQKRRNLRKEWSIEEQQILIGLVGRIDAMKDHPTFLEAASISVRENPNLRFVCIGDGKTDYWQKMVALSKQLNLDDYLLWAGSHSDMPSVYSSLDILCSSSIGEGFSNVIGEAMSCSLPCIVTDVGDSAMIVGSLGLVVNPSDANSLALAIKEMASKSEEERRLLGSQCRIRIEENFSLGKMIEKTSDTFNNCLMSSG